MIDREKVIAGLMMLADRKNDNTCEGLKCCKIAEDALALLKEQEAKSPIIHEKNGYWNYVCPICGSRNEELFREWDYCPFCGQAVKWE